MRREPQGKVFFLLEDYSKSVAARVRGGGNVVLAPDPRPLRLLLADYPKLRADRLEQDAAKAAIGPSDTPPPTFLTQDFDPFARYAQSAGSGIWPADCETPLRLETAWRRDAPRRRRAQAASAAAHGAALLLLTLPAGKTVEPSEPTEQREYSGIVLTTPSSAELAELIEQTAIEGEGDGGFKGLRAPPLPTPPAPVESEAPPAPEPEPAAETPQPVEPPQPPEPETEPEQPAVEPEKPAEETPPPAARSPAPDRFQRGRELAQARSPRELPMPKAPSAKKPKLQLEDPKAMMPGTAGGAQLGSAELTARPDQIIAGAITKMQRGGGRQAVGDGIGNAAAGGYAPPSPSNSGSRLELLSDPRGVDFRPYLMQVLGAVRRNWFAVIPESARLGMSRGRVLIQFSVARNGSVPKLVIAGPSGAPPLDRAAVAGISASNPFPPLPVEFTGSDIRLQFTFLYNMKTR